MPKLETEDIKGALIGSCNAIVVFTDIMNINLCKFAYFVQRLQRSRTDVLQRRSCRVFTSIVSNSTLSLRHTHVPRRLCRSA